MPPPHRPAPGDEHLAHQVPELLGQVDRPHPHWRESWFFELHHPGAADDADAVFFTMATYPARRQMDSLNMGRVGGERILGLHQRAFDGDPHTPVVGGARVEVVTPWEEVRLHADPATSLIGMDLTFRARTAPYVLRRGTMRATDGLVWDQRHILQSGTYTGTYTVGGTTHEVEGWVGQRDHSWGVRDHGRCPLWLWFQVQLDDGFLGVWHWELENGARIYTDGCWAPTGDGDPVPLVDFRHDVRWVDATGAEVAYVDGDGVAGLVGDCTFTLADGRVVEVAAEGTFARPYEPFHRGGLNLVRVRTGDGRTGSAIYEVTGARHHRLFPDCPVTGELPA